MSQDNNIPAFPLQYDPYIDHPTHGRIHRSDVGEDVQSGMTLLDYFAAKAMNEFINVMTRHDNVGYAANDGTLAQYAYTICAEYSYALASAMLEERKKYIKP